MAAAQRCCLVVDIVEGVTVHRDIFFITIFLVEKAGEANATGEATASHAGSRMSFGNTSGIISGIGGSLKVASMSFVKKS